MWHYIYSQLVNAWNMHNLALKLSVEFDEDAVLARLPVTSELASKTIVGSTQSVMDVTARTTWSRDGG